jgi:uncharacterized membrane protein YhaH (DUF805 family)
VEKTEYGQAGAVVNNIVVLLTSLDGRIGRGRFWLGGFLVVLLSIIVGAILMLLGLREVATGTTTTQVNGATTAISAFTHIALTPWGSVILSLAVAFPLLAVLVKRRHDKGNSAVDAGIIVGVGVLAQILGAAGAPGPAGIVSIVAFIGWVYLLVVCGFLKGTVGTNQYGPDPLGG